jgi:hypothetical protein
MDVGGPRPVTVVSQEPSDGDQHMGKYIFENRRRTAARRGVLRQQRAVLTNLRSQRLSLPHVRHAFDQRHSASHGHGSESLEK